jgi:hypothetical protein
VVRRRTADEHGQGHEQEPDGDHAVERAAELRTDIDRYQLSTNQGGATFVGHPGHEHVGMHVGAGQETSISFWLAVADHRLVIRETAGACLADISASGDFYLSMPHGNIWISVRDFADSEVRARRHHYDISDRDEADDFLMLEAAAIVTDDLVIVGITSGGRRGEGEQHLLLSTRTLRCQTNVDYDMDMPDNSIRSAGGRGRWLTHDIRSGAVRLWQLREPYTDEIEGQLTLW